MYKYLFFVILLIAASSCVSSKRYKADMDKLQKLGTVYAERDKKIGEMMQELGDLREQANKREANLSKLRSQVQELERKIADMQKGPAKSEPIKKDQKSSY